MSAAEDLKKAESSLMEAGAKHDEEMRPIFEKIKEARIKAAYELYWQKVMEVPAKIRQDPDGFEDEPYFVEAIKEAGLG